MSHVRNHQRLPAALGAVVLAALALIVPGAQPAGADAPVAAGWWSQGSSLPPPPDVSADGLYTQGGPSGPVAIAALRFQLSSGTDPDKLELIPNGVASPGATVQVCPLKAGSVDFKPAQNGAWADAPEYDCSGTNAIAGKADDSGALQFDVGTLPQDGVLAVAVIATGSTDRVPIAKPDASTLTTVASSTPAADTSGSDGGVSYPTDTATASSPTYAAPSAPSLAAPVAPSAPSSAAPSTDAGSGPVASSLPGPNAPLAIAAPSPHDLATRLGGLAAIAILVAALVAYSLGFGLLGGRFADA